MSEPNFTPADAPFTPGPSPADLSSQTPPAAQQQPQAQHEINDPPIEHDPWGQALVTLPFELAAGAGEALWEGGGMLAHLGKEAVAWGASELGIGAGESLLEGGEGGTGGADGTGGAPSGPDASLDPGSSDPADAGTGGTDTGDPGSMDPGTDPSADDPGMCVDPSQEADYSSDDSGQ